MVYPKFKQKEECAFPDRLDCNGDAPDIKTRCPYMKYNNSKSIFDPTRWECRYKKEEKQIKNDKKEENLKKELAK